MAALMTVWDAEDEFSDSLALDVQAGVGPHGAAVVSLWAGDEYDPAYLTPAAARKAAVELPAILLRLAEAADPGGGESSAPGRYFIAHQVTPDAYSMDAEPLPSYQAACARLVCELEVRADPVRLNPDGTVTHLSPPRPVVLVDLSSLIGAEGLTEALLNDPMVRAVFDAGRAAGRQEVQA